MVCIGITIQKKIEYEISQRIKTVFCQSQLYFVCSWFWSMSLSVCLMLGLINERRPGPPRGPVEDDILLFCYESFSPRNRRNSPKWRRARLNYSAFTINFHPPLPSSRHLSGPQSVQAHHGNVDNSLCDTNSGPVATWEVVGAWIFVSLQLSKTNCWIINSIILSWSNFGVKKK